MTLTDRQGIKFLYNNFFNDAFFLKTLSSNGVCPAWCKSGTKFPSPKVIFPRISCPEPSRLF